MTRITRRGALAGTAAIGATTILPFAARAQDGGSDSFATDGGEVIVHPVRHASFVMETPAGVIYADPVGEPAAYDRFPAPDLILITHEHGDHYAPETLAALAGEETAIISNPAVHGMMPEDLAARTTAIANGESARALGLTVDAIPAYNLTEGRLKYHPEGRDNGYVMTIDGLTVYIAGDTEGTPEMRALTGIDLAFVPMNLPYTMAPEQAADAVRDFRPRFVYPYHYRGQSPQAFAEMVGDAAEVLTGPWYA